MRDYQIRGLNWMISLYENGINGILADEMVCCYTCVHAHVGVIYYPGPSLIVLSSHPTSYVL